MKYIVGIIAAKLLVDLAKKIIFKIKNNRRIKRNEKIMSKGGRWYTTSSLTKWNKRGESNAIQRNNN